MQIVNIGLHCNLVNFRPLIVSPWPYNLKLKIILTNSGTFNAIQCSIFYSKQEEIVSYVKTLARSWWVLFDSSVFSHQLSQVSRSLKAMVTEQKKNLWNTGTNILRWHSKSVYAPIHQEMVFARLAQLSLLNFLVEILVKNQSFDRSGACNGT